MEQGRTNFNRLVMNLEARPVSQLNNGKYSFVCFQHIPNKAGRYRGWLFWVCTLVFGFSLSKNHFASDQDFENRFSKMYGN